jgi:hypothetical protein
MSGATKIISTFFFTVGASYAYYVREGMIQAQMQRNHRVLQQVHDSNSRLITL